MITNTINSISAVYMYTIKLSIGLIILMSVNIILGVVNSLFEAEFDVLRFLKGIGRAIILILCFSAVFFAGVLNKETLSIDMGAQVPGIDIIDAMHAMLLAGYFLYSKQVLQKMSNFVGGGWVPPEETIAPQIAETPNLPAQGAETASEEEGEYI